LSFLGGVAMRRYEQTAPAVGRTTPAPQDDAITWAVWIPLLRALVTGAACAALAWLGGWGLGYEADSLGIGAFVGVAAFLVAWLAMMAPRRASTVDLSPGTASAPSSRLVMVNPRGPEATTARDDRAERFAEFVECAERDSSTRRLRGLGFTDAEIAEYRDVLMRLDWAKWNSATDKRGGWALTSPAAEILAAMA
jgi:hypothetical protein